MNAKIGDCYLVQSGANGSSTVGKQLAIVVKRTKKNAYCYKLSIRQGLKLVAENYKLDPSRIIKKVTLEDFGYDMRLIEAQIKRKRDIERDNVWRTWYEYS